MVGKSEDAARKLDEKYCALRKLKSPSIPEEYCLNRDHNFVTYATEGNAGLNLRRNNYEEWSGFLITMTSKNPSPTEDDYKSVLFHEYFHVYQQAHIHTKDESQRQRMSLENPWWLEGGAEYMAQRLYSKQDGVRDVLRVPTATTGADAPCVASVPSSVTPQDRNRVAVVMQQLVQDDTHCPGVDVLIK